MQDVLVLRETVIQDGERNDPQNVNCIDQQSSEETEKDRLFEISGESHDEGEVVSREEGKQQCCAARDNSKSTSIVATPHSEERNIKKDPIRCRSFRITYDGERQQKQPC